jgi:hypothetical protein
LHFGPASNIIGAAGAIIRPITVTKVPWTFTIQENSLNNADTTGQLCLRVECDLEAERAEIVSQSKKMPLITALAAPVFVT